MHTPKQLIISILITALLSFAAGFFVGRLAPEKESVNLAGNKPAITDKEDTFQAGWNAAKEKIKESGLMMSGEIKAINGSVKEISGNKIVLNTNLINPLDDEALKTRTVIVARDTQIEIQKEKTAEEIKTEEAEQSTKIAALKEQQKTAANEEEKMEIEMQIMGLQMPVDFLKLEKAGISDIKAGDSISVMAEEDISQKPEFTVSRITIYTNLMNP